ncbi:MAG: sigma factor [Myxococcota bacterium]
MGSDEIAHRLLGYEAEIMAFARRITGNAWDADDLVQATYERAFRAPWRARFEAGTGLGIEVIEAQTALAVARLDLVQAVIQYNVSQVRLAAAVGHLTPDALPEDRR